MTITNSSLRLVALVTGVAVALALMGAVAIAPAQAAGLTQTQIQSITSLLASFGADAATIANVTAALNVQADPAPAALAPRSRARSRWAARVQTLWLSRYSSTAARPLRSLLQVQVLQAVSPRTSAALPRRLSSSSSLLM